VVTLAGAVARRGPWVLGRSTSRPAALTGLDDTAARTALAAFGLGADEPPRHRVARSARGRAGGLAGVLVVAAHDRRLRAALRLDRELAL
jgi:hypothetical protein